MQKSCGNCQYWTKLKSIKGLCDIHDYGWATSDSKPKCKTWKALRDTKPRDKTVEIDC